MTPDAAGRGPSDFTSPDLDTFHDFCVCATKGDSLLSVESWTRVG
jgi:hypothetical protein